MSSGAVEECDSDLGFEAFDRLAQGWLGHVEAFCGPSEVQFLGDADEISDLSE